MTTETSAPAISGDKAEQPTLAIRAELREIAKDAIDCRIEYLCDDLIEAAKPNGHKQERSIEKLGEWIEGLQHLSRHMAFPDEGMLQALENDGYTGVAAGPLLGAFAYRAAEYADEFASGVGHEMIGAKPFTTWDERERALKNATLALEIWELVEQVTQGLDDSDRVTVNLLGWESN